VGTGRAKCPATRKKRYPHNSILRTVLAEG
jgi:hypothetical protein